MVDEMNAEKVPMPYFGRMTHFHASMRDLDFEGTLAHHCIEGAHEEFVAMFCKLVQLLMNNKETEDD